jgi:hypothetical protein
VRREPDPISRRLKLGSRGSEPPNPPHPVEVVGANNSLLDIDHEDRETCRSPRGARSVSAFCSERDGHYADRVFAVADLVLSLLKQQSRRRSSTPNGFAFVPHTCRVLGQHSSGCRTSAVK